MRNYLLALLFITSQAAALEWSGKCIDVIDGDTVVAMYHDLPVRVRLHGIDAPESGQDFGKRAKQHVVGLIKGKVIRLEKTDVDRYHRVIARIWIDDLDVNRAMIDAGMAWVYTQYCLQDYCAEWREAEVKAREAKTGLWVQPNAEPPWEWRKKRR